MKNLRKIAHLDTIQWVIFLPVRIKMRDGTNIILMFLCEKIMSFSSNNLIFMCYKFRNLRATSTFCRFFILYLYNLIYERVYELRILGSCRNLSFMVRGTWATPGISRVSAKINMSAGIFAKKCKRA